MPAKSLAPFIASAIVVLGLPPAPAQIKLVVAPEGQKPAGDRPDEFKMLVREVTEAYKAPLEVDKDIRDELRKQYQNPSPDRERKILQEVRRLYATSPEQEERIVRELRRAYESQSAEQEDRVFAEIRRMGTLPPGTVPMSVQSSQAEKLYTRLDTNRDGMLSGEELPEGLATNLGKWDSNRDGTIEAREYWVYYQASLKTVSEKVASGEIPIKLPGGATIPKPQPPSDEEPKFQVFRAGKLPQGLPAWFSTLDTDRDGQVGLYEWRVGGGNLDEFTAMDLNTDGLLTAEEFLQWKKDAESATSRQNITPQRIQTPGRTGDGVVTVKPGTMNPPKSAAAPGVTEKKIEKILLKSEEVSPKGEKPNRGEAKDKSKGEKKQSSP